MNKPNAPWLKYYGDSIPQTIEYPQGSMYEAVRDAYETHIYGNGYKAAYEFQGKGTSYPEFFRKIDSVAKAFKAIGIEKGDMVTICSAGTLDTVLNFAALNKIGACAQFVNPNYFKVNSKKYIIAMLWKSKLLTRI